MMTRKQKQQVEYALHFALIMMSPCMSMRTITLPFEDFLPLIFLGFSFAFTYEWGYKYFYKQGYYKTFCIFFFIPCLVAAIHTAYHISSYGFPPILPRHIYPG